MRNDTESIRNGPLGQALRNDQYDMGLSKDGRSRGQVGM